MYILNVYNLPVNYYLSKAGTKKDSKLEDWEEAAAEIGSQRRQLNRAGLESWNGIPLGSMA